MNPGFDKDFSRLFQEIEAQANGSSISKSVQTELDEAMENLSEAKRIYNQHMLLYCEIKDILLEHNYGLKDEQFEEQNTEQPNVFKTLWESLSQAESKSYLNISMRGKPNPEECLFGLSNSDFKVDARQKKILHHNIQQHCIPLMEHRLKKKCIDLYQFWNPSSNKDSEGLVLAKANQLSMSVSKEQRKLTEMQSTLKSKNEEYISLNNNFSQSVFSSIKELEEKIGNLCEKPQMAGTKITSEWIESKCDYILSKIRVMKNHINGHTYTEETLQALEKVRYHLEQEIRRTERELQHTKQALFTYESIGDTFKQLLIKYTKLTTEIDNKKWALSELNKTK